MYERSVYVRRNHNIAPNVHHKCLVHAEGRLGKNKRRKGSNGKEQRKIKVLYLLTK